MSDKNLGSHKNPILIDNEKPFTLPYSSPSPSPSSDDLTDSNLHLHHRPPNPSAQLAPLIDLDQPAYQPSSSSSTIHPVTSSNQNPQPSTSTAHSSTKLPIIKTTRPFKVKKQTKKITHKRNQTKNNPAHSNKTAQTPKNPKLQLGAIPLHPDHTPLILSTEGPNRTRFLASQPSKKCNACSSIIRHYDTVKKSLHLLERELDNTTCGRQRCENANNRFLSKNEKSIEEAATTYLEMHLDTHHNCGTVLEVYHSQPVKISITLVLI